MLSGYKIYLFKRGEGLVKEAWWPSKLFAAAEKIFIGKYDGVMLTDFSGTVKALYGYCGI